MAIKDNIFILTHKACRPCQEISENLKGKLPVYDIGESDDAFNLIQKGIVNGVPSAIENRNGKYSKCKIGITEDGKSIIIECPNTTLEIEKNE